MTVGKEGHDQNRLQHETSPYLLQHADNPVNWYPWGKEAFETARTLDRPIFLSIGYSTCHWCHVMEKESFEDPLVAELMNNVFVCVKVDREERPDVDNVYMTVCQMMTQSGGWPLTIIMTPDKRPFYAATYIPKMSRQGRTGLMDLIPRIREFWLSNRIEITKSAEQITHVLKQVSVIEPGLELEADMLDKACSQLASRFDKTNGGFGWAPKFPSTHSILFLLRYWKRTGNTEALSMAEQTLKAMRRGGMYDHVGYGFHRYSTDIQWLIPHFEKMLYDQSLLAMAYTEAFQATGKEEYSATARDIFTYVLRDMRSPQGAFYSAEDADSEGVEGKFYLWSANEIESVLGKDDSSFFNEIFNIKTIGNYHDEATSENDGATSLNDGATSFNTGLNIIHLTDSLGECAVKLDLPEEEVTSLTDRSLKALFAVREKRVKPLRDDKILTDWNGLMIAALAKGARILEEPAYATAAQQAVDHILTARLGEDDLLTHHAGGGKNDRFSLANDYVFLIWGLLELYESTFSPRYLKTAVRLNNALLDRFWDDDNGGLFMTPDNGEELLARRKELQDGSIPAGGSVAMLNFLRLARILGSEELEEKAIQIGRVVQEPVSQVAAAHTMMMTSLDFAEGPVCEIVVCGDPEADDTNNMLSIIRNEYIPGKVVILRPAGEEKPEILEVSPLAENKTCINGKATAYICVGQACREPVTDPDMLRTILQKITGKK